MDIADPLWDARSMHSSGPRDPEEWRRIRARMLATHTPENQVGRSVPIPPIIARTADLVVSVRSITAYTNGVELVIDARRRPVRSARYGHDGGLLGRGPNPNGPYLGVGFADGRRAIASDRFGWSPDQGDGAVSLAPTESSGSDHAATLSYFLSPLPPDGPLTVVLAWPTHGLAETTHTVDGADILAASAQAIELWPVPADEDVEPPPPPPPEFPPGGWFDQHRDG